MADSKARQVDTDLIRDLATLLDDTGLTEIEIGSGDSRIRIARTVAVAPAAPRRPGRGAGCPGLRAERGGRLGRAGIRPQSSGRGDLTHGRNGLHGARAGCGSLRQ